MLKRTGEPVFSVVIPTYNRAQLIRRTLDSVQTQTFRDFECLIIDDGSLDGEALQAVVTSMNDERFRYVRQENAGASSARNKGFDLARGKFVALLDSDDSFAPEKLQRCLTTLNNSDQDSLVFSQMLVERGLDKKWIRPSRGIGPTERVDEYVLCTSGTIRTSTIVVTTSLARRVRFNESLPSLQDTDFAIRIAHAGATVSFIQEPLVIYDDQIQPTRISRNSKYEPLLAWLDTLRGQEISERAYWAGRGGQCARIASYSNRGYAVRLYLEAIRRSAFPFRQAVITGAQVLIPYRMYQMTANFIVTAFGRRVA